MTFDPLCIAYTDDKTHFIKLIVIIFPLPKTVIIAKMFLAKQSLTEGEHKEGEHAAAPRLRWGSNIRRIKCHFCSLISMKALEGRWSNDIDYITVAAILLENVIYCFFDRHSIV